MATIDIATLATELDTDARTTRKFLRSITPADAQPGKGSRWAIEKREVRSLKSKFAKFEKAIDEAKIEKANKVQDSTPATDDAELEGPSTADLEMIDADIDLDD